MATAHEKVGEEPVNTTDSYGYMIVCSCRHIIEELGHSSAHAAKTAAYTAWGLHLQGA